MEADQMAKKLDFMETLRAFFFHELGLRHTCCKYHSFRKVFKSFPDPEDIAEIQEEEREIIERLEKLLRLASEQWDTHTGTVLDFLKEFLRNNDLGKVDDPPEVYLQRLEDLGVLVEELGEEGERGEEEELVEQDGREEEEELVE